MPNHSDRTIKVLILVVDVNVKLFYKFGKHCGCFVADIESSENVDFSDVCRYFLGRWAEILSVIFSLIALVGGAVVYWVLMSNFLFHTVTFIHGVLLLS